MTATTDSPIVAPRYRKRPVEITAMRWRGNNADELMAWSGGVARLVRDAHESPRLEVGTLEGMMTASVGDYIICGVAGEYYPCRSDIFEQTYELVDRVDV